MIMRDKQKDEWINGKWMNGGMDEWMGGRMEGWMNAGADEWIVWGRRGSAGMIESRMSVTVVKSGGGLPTGM